MATAEKKVDDNKIQLPKEGQARIPLSAIDARKWPNYRQHVTENHLSYLSKSLKMNTKGEQKQCIGGNLSEDGSKLELHYGFCRYEAMHRNATRKVVEKYNGDKGYKPGDPEYIPVGGSMFSSYDIREQLRSIPEYKDEYEQALDSYMVDVKILKGADEKTALLNNIEENQREDPPLYDLCARINYLISQGLKQKDIAGVLQNAKTASAVSQHNSIFKLIPHLRDEVCDKLKEDRQPVFIEAIKEFEKRIKLRKDDPKSISFSHCREFAGAVQHKKEALTPKLVEKVLLRLVCFVDDAPSDTPTMDFGVFNTLVKDAKRISKLPEVEEAQEVSTVNKDSETESETVDSLAEKQKEEDENVSPEAEIQEENAAQSSTVTEDNEVEEPSDEDLQEESSSDEDITNDTLSDIENELSDVDVDFSEEDEVDEVPGEKRTNAQDAPIERYKLKSESAIESQANSCLGIARNDDSTMIDRATALSAALNLFDVVGLRSHMEATNETYVEFTEHATAYIEALESFVREHADNETKKELVKLRPVFVDPFSDEDDED